MTALIVVYCLKADCTVAAALKRILHMLMMGATPCVIANSGHHRLTYTLIEIGEFCATVLLRALPCRCQSMPPQYYAWT